MTGTRLAALIVAAATLAGLAHSAWADDPTNQASPSAAAAERPAPHWVRVPSGDDFAHAYPSHARQMNVGGRAAIKCTADAEGVMTDCQIVSETPANDGFGEAALSLSRYFKLSTTKSDGSPVAGTQITIPVRFEPQ